MGQSIDHVIASQPRNEQEVERPRGMRQTAGKAQKNVATALNIKQPSVSETETQGDKVMQTLLESSTDLSNHRLELRARNIQRVVDALKAHAPHLKPAAAKSIAVIMFYNMRTMKALVRRDGAGGLS
jgi:hypothetical protein